MRYRVIFTPKARADVLEAFRWIAVRSPDAAARWYSGLEKAASKLAKMPELHPVDEEESERFGVTLRQMLYGRRPGIYRLLFSIAGDTVFLHHVRHGSRGPIEP
ncbi:MAG: hypothetical protein NVSMB14_00810 [Isosphaeraceae bacterium]